MGCNCRGGKSSRRKTTKVSVSTIHSLCPLVESTGNSMSVTLGNGGHLYLSSPFSSDLNASVLLQNEGCTSAFSKAISGAELKVMSIWSNPSQKKRFLEVTKHTTVKLGFLREILRSF